MIAGLNHARGDAIIFIDVDCEDPPEMIPQFISFWEQGFDIVYGLRDKRQEPKFIELSRKFFYRFISLIGDHDTILDMAEFSLFTRTVRDVIISNKTTYPFIRNEMAYIGLQQKGICYNREKRVAGKTHYNFASMFRFAVAGILTASTFPLRLTMYISIPLFFLNLVLLLLTLLGYKNNLFNPVILLDMMFLIFSIPFISIYLARVYHDVMARPNYVIDWRNSMLNEHHP